MMRKYRVGENAPHSSLHGLLRKRIRILKVYKFRRIKGEDAPSSSQRDHERPHMSHDQPDGVLADALDIIESAEPREENGVARSLRSKLYCCAKISVAGCFLIGSAVYGIILIHSTYSSSLR